MSKERSRSDRGLWLAWFLASVMGFGMGAILGVSFANGLFPTVTFDATKGITLGIVMGATGGYVQWVVLRERIAGAVLWGLASALGFGLAMGAIGILGINENYAMVGILMMSVFGVVGGILQWLVLRSKVAWAGWWLWANLLGSLVGAIAVPIAAALGEAGKWDLAVMIFGAVFGAGNGAVTGATLVWLLSQSHSSDVEGLAASH